MPYYQFQWTKEIEDHLAENGITPEDFEYVVGHAATVEESRSSRFPATRGTTPDGRLIMAIYEHLDELTLLPVTAFVIAN